MNFKKILTEILFWLLSFLVAWIIWYPVNSEIDFKYKWIAWIQIVLLIQFFRWFVYYDQVIFFKKAWTKVVFLFASATVTVVLMTKGLDIIRLFDNQDPTDIANNDYQSLQLSYQGIYYLYNYAKTLLTFSTFGLFATSVMLNLKMIYRTVGYGNKRVKQFLENT